MDKIIIDFYPKQWPFDVVYTFMKAVKVEYTVQPEYVAENKKRIEAVMTALKKNPIPGMQYATFTSGDDPNSFIHINMAPDEETISKLNAVEEFTEFRMSLKASQPVSPPKSTKLDLVAAGFSLR